MRYNLILDFEALLMGHGFAPKHTRRKGSNVLYLKASEQIEDLLTFMGASGAALEIMNLKVYKDFRNKANRITNCETANIDKTVSASGQTLEAIAYLKKRGAFETLPAPLREAAALREQNPGPFPSRSWPGWSSPPLSKSGLFAPNEKTGANGGKPERKDKEWLKRQETLHICICIPNTVFLDGACRIEGLMQRVKALGQTAVAITDHGVMYGCVDFFTKPPKRWGSNPSSAVRCMSPHAHGSTR